jgi:hypothetical protein
MSNNNEIKIGDTVDCSGSILSNHSIVDGRIAELRDIGYFVTGKWSDGQICGRTVNPDQITRHVPAAPVKPASVGDKLASEMTVREEFAKVALSRMIGDYTTSEELAENVVDVADALIAALDKERTK